MTTLKNSSPAKHITSTRKNGSRRSSLDFTDIPVITDQAAAVDMSMLSIKNKLDKGVMFPQSQPFYSTDLGVKNLQDVHALQQQTEKLFYQLPTQIRSLMQNNINNFESVIFDPKNQELLASYDLLVTHRDNHKELIHALSELKQPNPDLSQDPPIKTPKKAP